MAHHPFLTPSPLEADCGNLIGRDPREISEAEWSEHLPEPLVGMKAIRAKCLDCCGAAMTLLRHISTGTLTAAGIVIVLAFGAWLVWPAIGAVSDAASSRSMCPGFTPDECAALAQGGW